MGNDFCERLTVKVSWTATNLFVDKFIRFGCIERLSNAYRCLIEMAWATFWYVRITINLQSKEWETYSCMSEVGKWKNAEGRIVDGATKLPLYPLVCVDCCNMFSASIWCRRSHIWSNPHGRMWNLWVDRHDRPDRRFRCIANMSIRRNSVDTSFCWRRDRLRFQRV